MIDLLRITNSLLMSTVILVIAVGCTENGPTTIQNRQAQSEPERERLESAAQVGRQTPDREEGLDRVTSPPWYQGSKPWSEISEEGRDEILKMRSGYKAYQERAEEPAHGDTDPDIAQAGQVLIGSICDEYGVDSHYKTPHMFGPRMVIWLPEAAWANLSDSEKQSVSTYMSSEYANWGIRVGRVSGIDVMADRLVVEQ